jgi:hypothetical protein
MSPDSLVPFIVIVIIVIVGVDAWALHFIVSIVRGDVNQARGKRSGLLHTA